MTSNNLDQFTVWVNLRRNKSHKSYHQKITLVSGWSPKHTHKLAAIRTKLLFDNQNLEYLSQLLIVAYKDEDLISFKEKN